MAALTVLSPSVCFFLLVILLFRVLFSPFLPPWSSTLHRRLFRVFLIHLIFTHCTSAARHRYRSRVDNLLRRRGNENTNLTINSCLTVACITIYLHCWFHLEFVGIFRSAVSAPMSQSMVPSTSSFCPLKQPHGCKSNNSTREVHGKRFNGATSWRN